MAPVPKKKHSHSRSKIRTNSPARRRPAIPNLSPCPSCKALKEPHKACPSCGLYKATS